MNRWAWVVALWAASAWAQQIWEEVDGGFYAGRRGHFLRSAEVFVPRAPDEALVFRDSDDANTEVRVRFIDASGTSVEGSILPDAGMFQAPQQINWGSRRLSYGLISAGVENSVPMRVEVTWSGGLAATFGMSSPYPGLSLSRGGRTIWNLNASSPFQQTDAGAEVSCTNCAFGITVVNADLLSRYNQPQAGNESVVNAGGRVVSLGVDMWEWSPNTQGWRTIGKPPVLRNRPALAWDSERQRLVFFGGQRNNTMFDDTWEWDGERWQHLATTVQPSPRMAHKMAFDPIRKRTVLFGGEGPSGVLGDTWEWDGTTWTQLSPTTSPSARDAMGLAWDGTRRQVLLFGGYTHNGPSNETWSWNGTVWEQLSAMNPPAARSSLTMTWDEARQRVVMVGALDTSTTSNAEWNGVDWTPIPDFADEFGTGVSRPGLTHIVGAGTFLFSGIRTWRLSNDAWVGPLGWYLGTPKVGTTAEDGGTVLFTDRNERLDWGEGWWRKTSDLPFQNIISVARDGSGRLIAIAQGTSGVVTWVSENGVWTERGAAPRGVLAADRDGRVHVFGNEFAARFSGTEWVNIPWPAGVTALAASPREEGGFWVNRQSSFGIVADGQWQQLTSAARGPLIADQPSVSPISVGSHFIYQPWSQLQQREDGGSFWQTIAVGNSNFDDPLTIAAGREPSGARVFVGTTLGIRYQPQRTTSSRCSDASQCLTGVCVDGRCCDRACGTSSCEVCSVERGASENGICTAQPQDVCAPRPTQVDGGTGGEETPVPEVPSGCGCASVDSLLALAALMVLARSRAPRRRA